MMPSRGGLSALHAQDIKARAEREAAMREQRRTILAECLGDSFAGKLAMQVDELESQLMHETGVREVHPTTHCEG